MTLISSPIPHNDILNMKLQKNLTQITQNAKNNFPVGPMQCSIKIDTYTILIEFHEDERNF